MLKYYVSAWLKLARMVPNRALIVQELEQECYLIFKTLAVWERGGGRTCSVSDDDNELMVVVVCYELGKHLSRIPVLICRTVLESRGSELFPNLRLREVTQIVNGRSHIAWFILSLPILEKVFIFYPFSLWYLF